MSFLSLCFYPWQFVVFIKHAASRAYRIHVPWLVVSLLLALESCPWNHGSIGLVVMFTKQRLSICLSLNTQAHTKVQIHVHITHTCARCLAHQPPLSGPNLTIPHGVSSAQGSHTLLISSITGTTLSWWVRGHTLDPSDLWPTNAHFSLAQTLPLAPSS